MEALVLRLEAAVARLEAGGAGAAAPAVEEDDSAYPAVQAFDKAIGEKLAEFKKAAAAVDGDVVDMTEMLAELFTFNRRMLAYAAKFKQPTAEELAKASQPIADITAKFEAWDKAHLRTKYVEESKATSSAIPFFGWYNYGVNAEDYAFQLIGSVEFYTNRILRNAPTEEQKTWARHFVGLLKAMHQIIVDFHSKGLQWNVRGQPFKPAAGAAAAAPVKKEEPKPAPAAKPKPTLNIQPRVAKKEPRVARVAPSVVQIENYDGADPVATDIKIQDVVQFSNCKNCTIRLTDKCKAASFLQCERCTIILGDVIGVVECTAVKRAQIWLTGSAHTMTMDKCDQASVFLSENSIDLQMITSICTSINVSVPVIGDEGNMVEFMIPEQIQTKFIERKPVNEIFVHE